MDDEIKSYRQSVGWFDDDVRMKDYNSHVYDERQKKVHNYHQPTIFSIVGITLLCIMILFAFFQLLHRISSRTKSRPNPITTTSPDTRNEETATCHPQDLQYICAQGNDAFLVDPKDRGRTKKSTHRKCMERFSKNSPSEPNLPNLPSTVSLPRKKSRHIHRPRFISKLILHKPRYHQSLRRIMELRNNSNEQENENDFIHDKYQDYHGAERMISTSPYYSIEQDNDVDMEDIERKKPREKEEQEEEQNEEEKKRNSTSRMTKASLSPSYPIVSV